MVVRVLAFLESLTSKDSKRFESSTTSTEAQTLYKNPLWNRWLALQRRTWRFYLASYSPEWFLVRTTKLFGMLQSAKNHLDGTYAILWWKYASYVFSHHYHDISPHLEPRYLTFGLISILLFVFENLWWFRSSEVMAKQSDFIVQRLSFSGLSWTAYSNTQRQK